MATRTLGKLKKLKRTMNAKICIDNMRKTVISVKVTSNQGTANATTAEIKIGNAVAWVDVRASTQTISPEVFASAERMAIAMRSWSSFEILITSSPMLRHHPTIRRLRKSRRHSNICPRSSIRRS